MMVLNILLVLFGFSFIIFIHELGHFLAARRAGITCPVFSIGFPLPAFLTRPFRIPDRFRNIFSFQKCDTEWRIGWIPLGGFVQMKGQSDTPDGLDENAGTNDDFRNVSYPNKVLVIAGGVIMNAITGVVFFILAFMVFGVTFVEPVVGGFLPADGKTGKATAAWSNPDIKVGDRILKVNGAEVTDFEDVQYEGFFSEGSVNMTLQRPDGEIYTTDVGLNHIDKRFDVALPALLPRTDLIIGSEEAGRSAGKLQPKDRLVAINGIEVQSLRELEEVLEKIPGGTPIELTVQDPAKPEELRTVTHTPRGRPSTSSGYVLGMAFSDMRRVSAIRESGPAGQAGMKEGDLIKRIRRQDGVSIRGSDADGWRTLGGIAEMKLALSEIGENPVELEVLRDPGGESVVLRLTPEKEFAASTPTIGIMAGGPADVERGPAKLTISDVIPGSPAAQAGLVEGDVVLGVKGAKTTIKSGGFLGFFGTSRDTTAMEQIAAAAAKMSEAVLEGEKPAPLELLVQRGSEKIEASLVPAVQGEFSQPLLVLEAGVRRTEPMTYGFASAITMGFEHTHKKVVRILQTLKGLFSGQVSITNLAGPVMIAKASYDLSKYGFGTLLFFLGFISINLAIVNFLPIPVLDGGLFVIATIERIKGSPLNETMMGWINTVAFLFVIGLMLFVVFNDIRILLPG